MGAFPKGEQCRPPLSTAVPENLHPKHHHGVGICKQWFAVGLIGENNEVSKIQIFCGTRRSFLSSSPRGTETFRSSSNLHRASSFLTTTSKTSKVVEASRDPPTKLVVKLASRIFFSHNNNKQQNKQSRRSK